MFCTQCGVQLGDPEPNFCPSCGQRTAAGPTQFRARYDRRLERPIQGRKIAGVCAAFADYFDVDVTFIRLLAVVMLVFGVGTPALAYIIAMIVIPEEQPEMTGETQARPSRA
jgi:phage shock protein C